MVKHMIIIATRSGRSTAASSIAPKFESRMYKRKWIKVDDYSLPSLDSFSVPARLLGVDVDPANQGSSNIQCSVISRLSTALQEAMRQTQVASLTDHLRIAVAFRFRNDGTVLSVPPLNKYVLLGTTCMS